MWTMRVRSVSSLEFGQHASEDLQPQVVFVAQSVCSALDDADLVIQALHEAEGDLVLWPAVGGDPVPMSFDHRGEFLIRLESLPLQTRSPVLEESPCPALAFVVPELTEGLPEEVRGVQALVGRQDLLERLAALERKVLATRKQRVLLALDVASILAAESAVLGLAHLIERIAQMAHDVKLVVQDRRLRCTRCRHVVKRLPHIHDGQANARVFFSPSQSKNSAMLASLRSVPPNQIGRLRIRSLTTMR